jgi:hypothetical protein
MTTPTWSTCRASTARSTAPSPPSHDSKHASRRCSHWVRFDRLIQGKQYSYMALKCEGFWYVTGPTQSGRARTWSELVDFIMSGNMPEVWLVNEYVRVGAA